MKILAVDDEILALKNLERKVHECYPEAEYIAMQSSSKALDYLRENRVDAAFLDIHMGDMDGLTLAKRIKELWADCAIVFVTAFSEYAVDAFALKASGYLLKPVKTADLMRELDFLRTRKTTEEEPKKGLVVQCFGNFEVFYDSVPLQFHRSKSKELLAYLIDRRGTQITMAQLAAVLWEDGQYNHSRNNQIHTFITELVRTLKQVGCEHLILKNRNAIAIDTSGIDCDYYRFLNGESEAVNSYTGEYMTQYWWSVFSIGKI